MITAIIDNLDKWACKEPAVPDNMIAIMPSQIREPHRYAVDQELPASD